MTGTTGVPIQVGEVTVRPGDYVIADASSIAFIAQAEIERVIEAAEAIWQRESLIARALRDGQPASQARGANYEQMLRK